MADIDIRDVAVVLRRFMAEDNPFADGVAVSMAEAVTPVIVAQVRAQIAADIEAQVSAFHGASKSTVLRIVRGES